MQGKQHILAFYRSFVILNIFIFDRITHNLKRILLKILFRLIKGNPTKPYVRKMGKNYRLA